MRPRIWIRIWRQERRYHYQVKAINYAGESAYSDEVNATTQTNGAGIPLDVLKVWLKADSGVGGNPMNCWVDQTTNNNTPIVSQSQDPLVLRPVWDQSAMNGQPAVYFAGTNWFTMTQFTTGWTQGEVLVVLKSLGTTSNNQCSGLWLMGNGSLPSCYPYTNGPIWENFGRGTFYLDTGKPVISLSNAHLYNVMSKTNSWISRLNNTTHYTNNINSVGFSPGPRLGMEDSDYFRGYISELMIFNRELTTAERDTVATNYLKVKFNLW